MESSLHYAQLALLVSRPDWLWQDRQNFFIGANLTSTSAASSSKTATSESLTAFWSRAPSTARASAARLRADQLAERLRALGVDPAVPLAE